MSDFLHASDFAPLLNQTIQIQFTAAVTLPAELIKVQETESYSPVDRKPFSIVLRTAQKKEYYEQSICTLQHPEKGALALFLVPIGFDDQGMKYEAVFA